MTAPRRLIDLYIIRYLRQKPQLILSLLAGAVVVACAGWLTPLKPLPALLSGWDAFTLIYLVSGWWMMSRADHKAIQDHAHLYDDGEFAVLLLSILAAILSMAAIVFILAPSPDVTPVIRTFHVILSVVTLASSWCFIHTSFAFHYAHGYYFPPDHCEHPPLIFPEQLKPNYMDFMYFSFVIGTSGQTADVGFASTEMRRIGLVHCIAAYLFNAAVLGLTINIAAGIIAGK